MNKFVLAFLCLSFYSLQHAAENARRGAKRRESVQKAFEMIDEDDGCESQSKKLRNIPVLKSIENTMAPVIIGPLVAPLHATRKRRNSKVLQQPMADSQKKVKDLFDVGRGCDPVVEYFRKNGLLEDESSDSSSESDSDAVPLVRFGINKLTAKNGVVADEFEVDNESLRDFDGLRLDDGRRKLDEEKRD